MASNPTIDKQHLQTAARLAFRGHGGAEPNPLVGCVIVATDGRTVGWGYHGRFGGPHAEIVALRRAGNAGRGSTMYVTLEPCNHHGKTGPCTEAIIAAGVARVVIARRDQDPIAAGGLERLRQTGIAVQCIESVESATSASDAFAYRVASGLPWTIAKWAQTIDGAIAARSGESKWISNQACRRMVHRERGRVDAILTGIGTVLADDPMLTARTRHVRRIARRIVIDPQLRIPLTAKLVSTAQSVPTSVFCCESSLAAAEITANRLRDAGVELIGLAAQGGELSLATVLRTLADQYGAANVLVEAGPSLLTRLFRQQLVCEAWVFIAPSILGDERARRSVEGIAAASLTQGVQMELRTVRRRGDDLVARYRISG